VPKREIFQELALSPIGKDQERWRWLYGELRAAILDGRLKPGSRMPSTRNLSNQYDLSRGTVIAAFDHLASEGYTEARSGSGTFVATQLPDDQLSVQRNPISPQPPSKAGLSKRGREMTAGIPVLEPSHSVGKAFRSWEPAIDLFPMKLWARIAGRVLRSAPRSRYGNGDARGHLPLRRAIAGYVGAVRGVRCEADQIIVTSGSQQALDLIGRILLDPGDRVWIEDPGYPGATFALRAAGATLIPIPVDSDGIDVAWARKKGGSARLVYVTPANQFPLGSAMSLSRRMALLNWAASSSAWIIEDDFDSEYRYSGRPLAALHSLDRSGSVIYIGTFTKMLFNALRLGFIVAPPSIVDAFAAARALMDRHPPTLDEAILTEFIVEGHFGHHVRRMRQVYAERMDVLAKAAERRLAGRLEIQTAEAGMRTVAWIRTGEKDDALAKRAWSRGLEVMPLSRFTIRQPVPDGLLLGFAACPPPELRRGVEILASLCGAAFRPPTPDE
jgi:GntR family transcriptional regulator/MocR family aminotransferase